jgi:hypothetical protein
MGFGPLAWPNQPGWSNPTDKAWVGQTDPDLPQSLTSPPRLSLRRPLNRRRHRLAILADSGEFHRCHLGQNAPLSTLSCLRRADLLAVSSPRRSEVRSRSEHDPLTPSRWFRHLLFLMLVAPLCGGHGEAVQLIQLMAEQARVEASQVGSLLVPPPPLR